MVFNAVLAAQKAVLGLARPGVSWVDCHRAAERAIVTALKEGGLLLGDVEEMLSALVGAVFFPHGLGHLIGCDTHDVGGYDKRLI
jgi:Xaa-Pro dipeptidase